MNYIFETPQAFWAFVGEGTDPSDGSLEFLASFDPLDGLKLKTMVVIADQNPESQTEVLDSFPLLVSGSSWAKWEKFPALQKNMAGESAQLVSIHEDRLQKLAIVI